MTVLDLDDDGATDASRRGAPGGPGQDGGEILCRDLVRIFATDGVEVQALQGLNLRVEPGEIVAVVGASGSGKSTLLTILSGLDTPTGGTATVAGTDLLAMGPKERVAYQRHTVGFVWQQTSRNLLPYLTARENVLLPLELAAGSRRTRARRPGVAPMRPALATRSDRARRVDDLLDLLEVGHVAGRRPAEMSGGQQQRVAIAVAMANSPRVLLADEPTGELDEATSVEVLEAMRGVNRETGVTTLVVTHDPTVSEHVARTVQIRDGRTSTETLRRTETDEHGRARHVSEEFAVLDRVGRLQLPEEFLTSLDLKDRVRLALEPDHVGVWPHEPKEDR
ncbi:ABC transporter ATP-binding protein [Myceligenerans indicum]|uniref:ABC transporter ATP-binding protein n=1 Tax=Myceligenerans indicum TaxID=2593663 RepID=A0ABS1LM58_9MICO|nr:ABC transporter ATP-binding protein [Myceligenerans indicum]MBL0886637.1 ABC transporter ATP-binding protein [Myceligenerans indicum]